LKQRLLETAPAVGGAGRRIIGGGGGRAFGADADVGRKPTVVADADVDEMVGCCVERRPSGTLVEHYRMVPL
jgi:hypothetical protein